MSEKVTIKVERKKLHLPTIALRGLVVFPNNLVHFEVGREKSIAAVEWAMANNSNVFLVAQKSMDTTEPQQADLFSYGVVAEVKQVLRVSGARWIWLIMAILVAEVGGGYFSRYRAYGQSRPDTASTCRKACALLSGEVCHTPMYFLPFLRFGRATHFSTITSACTDSSVSKNGSRCLRGCFRQRVRISSGRFKTGLPGKRSATPMWPCQPRVVPDLFTYSPKRSR